MKRITFVILALCGIASAQRYNFEGSTTSTADIGAVVEDSSGWQKLNSTNIGLKVPTDNVGIGNTAAMSARFGIRNIAGSIDALLITQDVSGADSGLVFTKAGRLGIGTTSPVSLFNTASNSANIFFADLYSDNDSAPAFASRKSRGTSSAPLAILANDQLLFVGARGYQGSAFSTTTASLEFYAAENYSPTNLGAYAVFNTTSLGATSRTERLRITAAGLVGISTTVPQSLLDVQGPVGTGASAEQDGASVGFEYVEISTMLK